MFMVQLPVQCPIGNLNWAHFSHFQIMGITLKG